MKTLLWIYHTVTRQWKIERRLAAARKDAFYRQMIHPGGHVHFDDPGVRKA